MDISFKYTCGLVNVEQSFHVEFEPNERVDMTSWIIDKATQLEQAGMKPAVVKSHSNLGSPIALAHGANGRHPDDLTPELSSSGTQIYCPKCAAPLYRKNHVYKGGRNAGKPGFIIGHAKKTDCDYTLYLDERGK
jgi:hypothetical protein